MQSLFTEKNFLESYDYERKQWLAVSRKEKKMAFGNKCLVEYKRKKKDEKFQV